METAKRTVKGQGGGDRTLSDKVYEDILALIVEGRFAVGAKLPTEHALCDQMQVSRPVLRQALKQLREDGLIVSRQGSGSFVQKRPDGAVLNFAPVGSIADIQRSFEFRAGLEGEAAALAALRRTEADLGKLTASLDELDRCVRAGELGVEEDEQFHAVICAASDNQYYVTARASMRGNILTGMNLTRNLSLAASTARMRLVQAEHYAIYDAIEAQDCTAARAAMRAHIENARRRVFEGSAEG